MTQVKALAEDCRQSGEAGDRAGDAQHVVTARRVVATSTQHEADDPYPSEAEMTKRDIDVCVPVDISDKDIYEAMSEIPGYLDITPGDFKEVYLKAYQHALRRLSRSVGVGEVMAAEVVTVLRKTPISEVAEVMAQRRVSGVPVLEADGSVAGVISERDFLWTMGGTELATFMHVVAECLKGGGCLAAPMRVQRAEDIMSSPAVTVTPDTPLMDVANIMVGRKINRVPVVDEAGKLLGIASRADVVRSSLVS
ncbi:MAG: CBS domain-containing protein [Desulfomonilaceae bacterium]|nr:CBS domain-containing protein [Desulfomonilaceae bacterium]